MPDAPTIIELQQVGTPAVGYITVAQYGRNLPFEVKRVYWTYDAPADVVRGQHAHREVHQVLIAINGTISVELESVQGTKQRFVLDHPNRGLYVPPLYWGGICFSRGAVLLVLASLEYDSSEYIRDYKEFKAFPPSA